jgi:hypothetical protein
VTTREPLKPEVYARVFDSLPEGKLVLDELIQKFARNPYKPGGRAAQRETDYRAGQLSVPTFIMNRLNQAAGVEVPDEE